MSYCLLLDLNRCSGCNACVVACMDQNDIFTDRKHDGWRQVFQVERGSFPVGKITYISLSCMHCHDAPCVLACPTGTLTQDVNTGIVHVQPELCIGCHSCSLACPFGIPRFGNDGKMQKCEMCEERISNGLEPACVRTCPTKALTFGEVNELAQQKEFNAVRKICW